MKNAVRRILICLLLGASGCASHPSLGEPVNDAARRAALLQACPRPSVRTAVFQTLICWPGREISLTEVVKIAPDGGFSVAGVTDIGSTLYAAQVAPDGQGRVIRKSLPFSDRWLLDGLVAELLLPWRGPDETCRLFVGRAPAQERRKILRLYGERGRSPYTLVRETDDDLQVFLFDDGGHWQGLRRFTEGRLRCQASFEWDAEPIPQRVQVDNPRNHYHVVRERVSIQ